MRLMVYSHDTYGLGNIRRMLEVCGYLLEALPDLWILLVSGSSMLHSFRLPDRLDYIKVPCLGRTECGVLSATHLPGATDEIVRLRGDLIRTAAINFKPDMLLVDKKPYGLQGELRGAIAYLKSRLPNTKLVLLLREILDSPEETVMEWQTQGYYEAVAQWYDRVLVVGMPQIFDTVREYRFPPVVAAKTRYCGYIRRSCGRTPAAQLRQALAVAPSEKLAIVTPGGGGDGFHLASTYLAGIAELAAEVSWQSLIVCGPEMKSPHQQALYRAAAACPQVRIMEFTDDMNSYVNAADVVVSMAGYNTICEILSLQKPAVVVPRTCPSQEQWIRASRMAQRGWLTTLPPDDLTPQRLIQAVGEQLHPQAPYFGGFAGVQRSPLAVDLEGLPRIAAEVVHLLGDRLQCSSSNSSSNRGATLAIAR